MPYVSDFGSARMTNTLEMTIGIGTKGYMAPEIGGKSYTNKVDSFSFG